MCTHGKLRTCVNLLIQWMKEEEKTNVRIDDDDENLLFENEEEEEEEFSCLRKE